GEGVARLGLERDALEVARRLARSAIVTAKGCDAGLPQLARQHRLKEELEIARANGVAVSVLGTESAQQQDSRQRRRRRRLVAVLTRRVRCPARMRCCRAWPRPRELCVRRGQEQRASKRRLA